MMKTMKIPENVHADLRRFCKIHNVNFGKGISLLLDGVNNSATKGAQVIIQNWSNYTPEERALFEAINVKEIAQGKDIITN